MVAWNTDNWIGAGADARGSPEPWSYDPVRTVGAESLPVYTGQIGRDFLTGRPVTFTGWLRPTGGSADEIYAVFRAHDGVPPVRFCVPGPLAVETGHADAEVLDRLRARANEPGRREREKASSRASADRAGPDGTPRTGLRGYLDAFGEVASDLAGDLSDSLRDAARSVTRTPEILAVAGVATLVVVAWVLVRK